MTTKTCVGPAPGKAVSARGRRPRAEAPDGHLTARERELITLIAQGLPNKVIAHELGISPNTVRAHVCNVMRKYKLRNRVQIAMLLMPMLKAGVARVRIPAPV